MKVDFYNVDLEYIAFLKAFEQAARGFTRVPNVRYQSGNNKFFYGAVLSVNGFSYFVPISHHIHNKQDDLLIVVKDKRKPIVGTLRFAYMLPMPKEALSILVRDEIPNIDRREKVRKELAFCRRNKDKIEKMAHAAYTRITAHASADLMHNSCDFKLLEQACLAYCQQHRYEMPSPAQATERKYFYFELTQKQLDTLKKEGIPCEYTQKDTRLIARVPKEFEEQARTVISGITAGLK